MKVGQMFYAKEMSKALRFGDVLRGYLLATPVVKEPALKEHIKTCNIDVNFPTFVVVMDPCCQIGHKAISLTPLLPIRVSFLENPYLAEDLTRINRKMEPEQAVPPHVWKRMPEEEKAKRLAEGLGYAFVSLFVYEKHDLLPRYTLHRKGGRIETNYYMIDFRNTYKLCCDKIKSPEDAPLESKVLELSVETRQELRNKVAAYYARVPPEDKIAED